MPDETALDLIGILLAPESPVPDWTGFLAGLSRELDGAFCCIWSQGDLSTPIAAHPPKALELMRNWHLSEADRYQPLLQADLPLGQIITFSVGASALTRALFEEVAAPAGVTAGEACLVPLASDGILLNSGLSLICPDGLVFDERTRPLLEQLMPWLLHAARATLDESLEIAAANAMYVANDRLRVGMIFVSTEGEVTYANRAGASCLEGNDVPFYRDTMASAERVARIQQGLDRLLEHESHGADAHPEIILSRLTLDPGNGDPFGRSVASAIFVADPAVQSVEWLGEIQKRYGLTPAETRLAALLVSDLSLTEAAGRLGVTVGTVRTRLKQVFSKTDTHRQAGLIRLLLAEGQELYPE